MFERPHNHRPVMELRRARSLCSRLFDACSALYISTASACDAI